jgi:hypothetical protein
MNYDIKHLEEYGEKVIGPVQSDEALLLFSLIRVLRPKTIVEFGYAKGHSSANFLKAASEDAIIYSYDILDESKEIAEKVNDERLKYIHKSQTDFTHADIDNKEIDFVFFDASHNDELNIETFNLIVDHLTEEAVVAVHDTGAWDNSCNEHPGATDGYYVNGWAFPKGYFLNDQKYIHQAGERKFVNHLREHEVGIEQIHLHSSNTFRHGLTLLQKRKVLEV